MWPAPITLESPTVTLVPLGPQHADDLRAASADGDLHQLWYTSVPAPDAIEAEITRRLELQSKGAMLPFAVLAPSGQAVGMTTYMNIDAPHRRVEIGSTWYRRSVQRSGLNTAAKRLLLSHAFDTLDCIAVEFRTHFMNRQSRAAIERLGAKMDGILRSHSIGRAGELRDTVVYSIIASEWPAVRTHLDTIMARAAKGTQTRPD